MADLIRPVDRALQRRAWTAFPLAVVKKFGGAGRGAADDSADRVEPPGPHADGAR